MTKRSPIHSSLQPRCITNLKVSVESPDRSAADAQTGVWGVSWSMCERVRERGEHLLLNRFPHRSAPATVAPEEDGVLRDDGQLPAKRIDADAGRIDAIKADGAAADLDHSATQKHHAGVECGKW